MLKKGIIQSCIYFSVVSLIPWYSYLISNVSLRLYHKYYTQTTKIYKCYNHYFHHIFNLWAVHLHAVFDLTFKEADIWPPLQSRITAFVSWICLFAVKNCPMSAPLDHRICFILSREWFIALHYPKCAVVLTWGCVECIKWN